MKRRLLELVVWFIRAAANGNYETPLPRRRAPAPAATEHVLDGYCDLCERDYRSSDKQRQEVRAAIRKLPLEAKARVVKRAQTTMEDNWPPLPPQREVAASAHILTPAESGMALQTRAQAEAQAGEMRQKAADRDRQSAWDALMRLHS